MAGFFKNWTKHHKKGIKEKAKDALRVHGPSRPSTIELQISKLDNRIADAKDMEVSLFNKIVNAIQSHNDNTAKILSNELANVRRNQRILNQARRTLEQVSIRNSTLRDMLEIMETLKPAIQPIKGLRSGIRTLQPDIGKEITYMQMITDSVMSETNQNNEMNIDIVNPRNGSENDIDQVIAEASHRVDE
jgi:division protein CdvB (Snf7/Vps24/ESCRT-III family)